MVSECCWLRPANAGKSVLGWAQVFRALNLWEGKSRHVVEGRSVIDNGVGRPDGFFAQAKNGLGTSIVKALAQQLDAQVETLAGPDGTTVAVTRATFAAKARVA